jgi:hypothetical protein
LFFPRQVIEGMLKEVPAGYEACHRKYVYKLYFIPPSSVSQHGPLDIPSRDHVCWHWRTDPWFSPSTAAP